MAKNRESAERRQRQRAKQEKANAKRERRMNRNAPSDADAEDEAPAPQPAEVVDEEALLAELAQLHSSFENEQISFEDFEARREELLSKLELDPGMFARCVESEEVTGQLTPDAAKKLGLSTNCMVVGGAGDCAAGAVGNGIVQHGVLSTSIGTSGVVFVLSDTPQVDPEGRLHTFCHAVRGKWHMMGVTLAAGGSLQWFRNALCETVAALAKKLSGSRTKAQSRAGHVLNWGLDRSEIEDSL